MLYPLSVLRQTYSMYTLNADDLDLATAVPKESACPFFLTVEGEEVSILAKTKTISKFNKEEPGWRALKIAVDVPLSESGILKQYVQPLSEKKITVLVMSTYRTDYIFVKDAQLRKALSCLRENGIIVTKG